MEILYGNVSAEMMYDAVEAVYHFDNHLYTLYHIVCPGRERQ